MFFTFLPSTSLYVYSIVQTSAVILVVILFGIFAIWVGINKRNYTTVKFGLIGFAMGTILAVIIGLILLSWSQFFFWFVVMTAAAFMAAAGKYKKDGF
jgi:uncharacterized protein YacL